MLQRHCLNQKELARRWGISHRTLERWRYTGQGPAFLKLGGRVLYRMADVAAFEQSRLQHAVTITGAVVRTDRATCPLTAATAHASGSNAPCAGLVGGGTVRKPCE